jgi:hypothetical protein
MNNLDQSIIEDASQFDHVDMVNAIYKATGCNRPLSSDYFTGDINLTVFIEEMFKAQAARQSSQSEPIGYVNTKFCGVFYKTLEDYKKAFGSNANAQPVYTAPQQAIPSGYAIVPHRLTKEMDRVLNEEDWQWEDLLAAANAITEQEYQDISTTSPTAPIESDK